MNYPCIRSNRFRKFFLVLILLLLTAFTLAACGNPTPAPGTSNLPQPTPTSAATATPTSPPTATPAPTSTPLPTATPKPTVAPAVSDGLKKAADAQAKLNSLHFVVDVKAGKAQVRGSELKQAEGDIKRPEDFQASVKVNSLFGTLSVEVLGVNNEQFTTNPITGGWIKSNKESYIKMAALLDPTIGVSAILQNLSEPKLIGPEVLNGENTVRYQGISSGKLISPLTIYALGNYDALLDIWVGTNDNLVRQINLKEIGGDAIWTITFSKFDEPVNIKRPNV